MEPEPAEPADQIELVAGRFGELETAWNRTVGILTEADVYIDVHLCVGGSHVHSEECETSAVDLHIAPCFTSRARAAIAAVPPTKSVVGSL